jgi:hypothetical protein
MCQLNQGFKLCSCDEDQLKNDEVDWLLYRANQEKPKDYRKGKAVVPRYSEEEEANLNEIALELNQADCFDFEYSPQENDRLQLKIKDHFYAFRFQNGHWNIDKSTALDGWRSQLEEYKNGKLE